MATNSLPVPDSPKICTGAWLRATRAIISRMWCMAADVPSKRGPNTLVSPSFGSGQLDGGRDQFAQTREIQGLGDEIEGAQFERAHGGLHIAMCGDHGHRYARRVLLHPLDQLQAIAVGQLHVGQAQIEALGL